MTTIVRDLDRPGAKMHKKEVVEAVAPSLTLHLFEPLDMNPQIPSKVRIGILISIFC